MHFDLARGMTYAWVEQWFGSDAAKDGGVIRRQRRHVEKHASLDMVEKECRKRSWHLLLVGDQVVVICGRGSIELLC